MLGRTTWVTIPLIIDNKFIEPKRHTCQVDKTIRTDSESVKSLHECVLTHQHLGTKHSNMQIDISIQHICVFCSASGKYEDFHTIDWQRDVARDRLRHRILWRRKSDSVANFCRCLFDALSAWLCVSIVGIVAGKQLSRWVGGVC